MKKQTKSPRAIQQGAILERLALGFNAEDCSVYSDVALTIPGVEPSERNLHRMILAESGFFRTLFSWKAKEPASEDGRLHISLDSKTFNSRVTPTATLDCISLIYGAMSAAVFDCPKNKRRTILEEHNLYNLFETAQFLEIPWIINVCAEAIVESHRSKTEKGDDRLTFLLWELCEKYPSEVRLRNGLESNLIENLEYFLPGEIKEEPVVLEEASEGNDSSRVSDADEEEEEGEEEEREEEEAEENIEEEKESEDTKGGRKRKRNSEEEEEEKGSGEDNEAEEKNEDDEAPQPGQVCAKYVDMQLFKLPHDFVVRVILEHPFSPIKDYNKYIILRSYIRYKELQSSPMDEAEKSDNKKKKTKEKEKEKGEEESLDYRPLFENIKWEHLSSAQLKQVACDGYYKRYDGVIKESMLDELIREKTENETRTSIWDVRVRGHRDADRILEPFVSHCGFDFNASREGDTVTFQIVTRPPSQRYRKRTVRYGNIVELDEFEDEPEERKKEREHWEQHKDLLIKVTVVDRESGTMLGTHTGRIEKFAFTFYLDEYESRPSANWRITLTTLQEEKKDAPAAIAQQQQNQQKKRRVELQRN